MMGRRSPAMRSFLQQASHVVLPPKTSQRLHARSTACTSAPCGASIVRRKSCSLRDGRSSFHAVGGHADGGGRAGKGAEGNRRRRVNHLPRVCAAGKKGPEDGMRCHFGLSRRALGGELNSSRSAVLMTYVEGDGEGRCGSAGECSMVRTIPSQNYSHRRRLRSFVVVVAACRRSWCWRVVVGFGGGGEHGGYAYVGDVFGGKCGLCWCWLWGWCRSGGSHGWSSLSGSRPRREKCF